MREQLRNPPPAYRSLVKVLHWLVILLMLLLLSFGNMPLLKWALIGAVVIWYAGFGAYGILARPSSALTGQARKLFFPMHLVMAGLPGILAVTLLGAEAGPLTGSARTMAIVTLGAGLLHGIFHFWRHTVLHDGALRNMLPKFMHGPT